MTLSLATTGSVATVDTIDAADTAVRLDIQALRALAVTMVIVYHFWPSLLPGGFIGVDVFFVISGFLITSHLYRHPPRTVRGFLEFWSRRVLRLIPAAAAAILGTLALVVLVLSEADWTTAARHATASMLYVENWLLIRDATDYLGADADPSPFQHFWSLSVEEQFYLVWPFVIGLAVLAVGRDAVLRRRAVATVVALVALASFGYGLALTFSNPPVAYFASPARMWELAIGGVLAVAVSGSAPPWAPVSRLSGDLARSALSWGALGVLVISCFAITESTPFPGWVAVAPTVATAVLLFAGDPDGRFTLRRVIHARPVQLLGDVSYAAYLWHWPLVLLVPVAVTVRTDAVPENLVKLLLLPLLALLAWLSTRFLEDPLRRVPVGGSLRMRALVSLLVSTGLVIGTTVAITSVVDRRNDAVQARIASLTADIAAQPCLGAAAMEEGADCPADAPLVTTPDFAREDIPSSIIVGDCINWPPFGELISCSLGDTSAPERKIALFGNSHAGHWQPPLEKIATELGWQVDTFVIGACQPSVEPITQPEAVNGVSPEELNRTCQGLVRETLRRTTENGYDLVVMSTMDHDPVHADWDHNIYRSTLATITAADVPVLVLRDTPASMDTKNDPPTCLGLHPDNVTACAGPPAEWIRQDPLTTAAERSDSDLVRRLDLNDYLCTPDACPSVMGGIVAYADYNHMSATFSRTLAPYLAPAVLRAMHAE